MELCILHVGEDVTAATTTCATLIEIHKLELMPNDNEISAMEAFLSVMKPIVEMTEVICGEKWVSLL